jgi:hypothetical protein
MDAIGRRELLKRFGIAVPAGLVAQSAALAETPAAQGADAPVIALSPHDVFEIYMASAIQYLPDVLGRRVSDGTSPTIIMFLRTHAIALGETLLALQLAQQGKLPIEMLPRKAAASG